MHPAERARQSSPEPERHRSGPRVLAASGLVAAVRPILDRLTALDGVDGACATLMVGSGRGACAGITVQVAAGDELSQALARSATLGEGPPAECLAAAAVVAVADLDERARARWPRHASALAQAGARALVAAPVVRDGAVDGAVTIAGRRTAADAMLRRTGVLAAALVATAIDGREGVSAAEEERDQLRRALESRVVIEQAKGMLAERWGIPPEAAFDSLRHYARGHNLKLRDLAAGIVSPSPTSDGPKARAAG